MRARERKTNHDQRQPAGFRSAKNCGWLFITFSMKRSSIPLADGTGARNPAFDVTPAHLVTGLITERGVCAATPEALATMFPDRAPR